MVGRNILLSWVLTTEVEHILLLQIITQGCLKSSYDVIQFPETFVVIQDENAYLREIIPMYLFLFYLFHIYFIQIIMLWTINNFQHHSNLQNIEGKFGPSIFWGWRIES